MARRSPVIALLLSVITPGLGHLYAGAPRRAAVFFLFDLLYPLVGLTNLHFSFAGMVVLLSGGLGLLLFTLVDAFWTARKNRDLAWSRYNRWFHFLFGAVMMLTLKIVYPIESLLRAQSFRLRSPSMQPTLQPGDVVLAQHYRSETTTLTYGDLVAFQQEGEIWLFRVGGLPGDRVRMQDDFLVINNQPTARQQAQGVALYLEAGDLQPILHEGFLETLPNGRTMKVLKMPLIKKDKATTPLLKVPEDCYFLVGDNRDMAADSRYIGLVSRDRIRAKALYILYSSDWKKIGRRL